MTNNKVLTFNGIDYVRLLRIELGATYLSPSGTVLHHCREESDDEMMDRILADLEQVNEQMETGEDNV